MKSALIALLAFCVCLPLVGDDQPSVAQKLDALEKQLRELGFSEEEIKESVEKARKTTLKVESKIAQAYLNHPEFKKAMEAAPEFTKAILRDLDKKSLAQEQPKQKEPYDPTKDPLLQGVEERLKRLPKFPKPGTSPKVYKLKDMRPNLQNYLDMRSEQDAERAARNAELAKKQKEQPKQKEPYDPTKDPLLKDIPGIRKPRVFKDLRPNLQNYLDMRSELDAERATRDAELAKKQKEQPKQVEIKEQNEWKSLLVQNYIADPDFLKIAADATAIRFILPFLEKLDSEANINPVVPEIDDKWVAENYPRVIKIREENLGFKKAMEIAPEYTKAILRDWNSYVLGLEKKLKDVSDFKVGPPIAPKLDKIQQDYQKRRQEMDAAREKRFEDYLKRKEADPKK